MPAAQPPGTTMTRAERFEDEKRRMIESCFSKLDQNGQRVLNYPSTSSYPANPCLHSGRVVHHTHSHCRGCRTSVHSAAAFLTPREQEAACHCRRCPQYGPRAYAQGAREQQRLLLNRQDVEPRGLVCHRDFWPSRSQCSPGKAESLPMGIHARVYRHHFQALLLGRFYG